MMRGQNSTNMLQISLLIQFRSSRRQKEEVTTKKEEKQKQKEFKVKSEAAEADLLFVEKKKSQPRKKQNKIKKKTSTSMANPLDKTIEHILSANVETDSISVSLQGLAEDSLELEDTLASERVDWKFYPEQKVKTLICKTCLEKIHSQKFWSQYMGKLQSDAIQLLT